MKVTGNRSDQVLVHGKNLKVTEGLNLIKERNVGSMSMDLLVNYIPSKLTMLFVMRDLVPFAQFKKREKHSWRNVTFSKVEG